jgi:hypothetical protein
VTLGFESTEECCLFWICFALLYFALSGDTGMLMADVEMMREMMDDDGVQIGKRSRRFLGYPLLLGYGFMPRDS